MADDLLLLGVESDEWWALRSEYQRVIDYRGNFLGLRHRKAVSRYRIQQRIAGNVECHLGSCVLNSRLL
jgi:hypothetical protein